MSATNSLKFPSGRTVKRAKQDAKALAKHKNIPLYQALNEVASANGSISNWEQALASIRFRQPLPHITQPHRLRSQLSIELGISDDDIEQLSYEVQTNESNDGLIYDYILTFDESNHQEILDQIEGLTSENTIRVSMNAFDEPDQLDKPVTDISAETDMNPYRKLLVLGLNEILSRELLSLNWDGETSVATSHIETTIAGHNSIVSWSDAGFGEVRISVWWKYDHNQHPQANLMGNSRESFSSPSPLAKRKHFPKFVGVVCSAWLERDKGKYLQGNDNDHLIEKYTRKGELELLTRLPNPIPQRFEPEGRFHM